MAAPGLKKHPPLRRTDLADREALLLWRHRLKWRQDRAARRLGVSHSRYGRMERGLDAVPSEVRQHIRKQLWGKVLPHEECLILRTRMGKLHRHIAQELHRCRYWVGEQERGKVDCTELLEHLRRTCPFGP